MDTLQHTERYTVISTDREAGAVTLAASDGDNVLVDGLVLEAQLVASDQETLVCLTDDSPYDEGLHIYLIASDGEVLDAVSAGSSLAIGVSGIFEIRNSGPDWLEFVFFKNDSQYRLSIKDASTYQWRLPRGWKYQRFFAKHRMTVREVAMDGPH